MTPAYAIAVLRDVHFGAELIRYMREIDSTLTPFGGEFVVHGGAVDAVEGDFGGDVVILRFPDRAAATGWYQSEAYRRILPLRLRNAIATVAIVDGVGPGHTGSYKVDELLSRDGAS